MTKQDLMQARLDALHERVKEAKRKAQTLKQKSDLLRSGIDKFLEDLEADLEVHKNKQSK
jgi:hypothetical protein